MSKYIRMTVKAGNQVFHSQMRLVDFIEQSGIEIDLDDEVDEFTNEEIGDFAIEKFSDDETRYCMNIDEDDEIQYVGFEILDETHDDLIV